jgi:flavin-dependent dehydrogenase
MTVDYFIIGQGLAGTSVARRIEQAGKSVLVIDDGLKSSSSLVAAGMWNPIVFKRLNKSWKAD